MARLSGDLAPGRMALSPQRAKWRQVLGVASRPPVRQSADARQILRGPIVSFRRPPVCRAMRQVKFMGGTIPAMLLTSCKIVALHRQLLRIPSEPMLLALAAAARLSIQTQRTT